ncbi:restriction endonuclease subunit S [Elizabethkingia meningoseptica]|uniref:restriction endonuclease subunit S n=1 Tax=Elizabethkingia meningoseptica TaxID=238 RepID=UPI0009357112|nr:restriction endonuclease subunit S [Elizabethkingia meningoseptica]EJK5330085.1 restriction endonuclease subunit S [Elizabethkingia meningoseptica]MDE5466506.1 restriction endonuclease subunit S [Elizabethkingia meningoseptica]MDE5474264.1 restriction endonuclease subunit S [Elizabethkingia meningoseptica]MDE5477697.1 restriction endonuclease subunit S [Elizabethkingia meningoseptica]MDE5483825.1 restriction endonuclease subunit S [Elizabethkingia meningoseptica]
MREDWIACNFEQLITYSKGKKPRNLAKEQHKGFLPYINIKVFEKNIIEEYSDDINTNLCKQGDILMVWDGARAGFLGKSITGIVGSTLMKIEPSIYLEKEFIYHYLKSLYRYLNTNTKGVGIPHVEPNLLWKRLFFLPPVTEQRIIIKKMETLFSSLDAGIADLKNSQEQLKTYRQIILKKAFEGEYEIISLNKIITKITQGWSPKCFNHSREKSEEWAVIKTTAIQYGRFIEYENKLLPENIVPRTQHELKVGDILITRAGPRTRVGVCCVVRNIQPRLINCDKVYRVNLNETLLDPYYFELLINSDEYLEKIDNLKTGGNDSGVNLTQNRFLSLEIPFPSLKQQQKIVKEIESRLSVCDDVEKQIENSLNQAEALRQSILKKAFEGNLLTEEELKACKAEPDYEPASVLLEKIKAEKEAHKPLKKISKKKVS